MNLPLIGHKLTLPSSLAGKRKLSPSKKNIRIDQTQLRQGSSRVDTPTRTHGPTTDLVMMREFPRNTSTSGSSSSFNLNSWDGAIEDYFDDLSNNSLPFSQAVGSGPNHELSVTGDDCTLPSPSHPSGPAWHPIDLNAPETVTRVVSEDIPIL